MVGCEHDRQAVLRELRTEAAEQLAELERRVAAERRPMTDDEREEHNRLFLRAKRYAEGRL